MNEIERAAEEALFNQLQPRELNVNLKLISDITVTPVQQLGGDHMVVAAAKVSVDGVEALKHADPENKEARRGLIRYLMRQKHGSPFEHGMMTFFVHMPLFIAQEWTRHRAGWSYNGESGRYKQLEPVFWVPRRDRPMMRPPDYQAARPTYNSLDDDAWYDDMLERSKWAYSVAYYQYLRELDYGVVPEVARRLLPTATYTSYWVTCNPRSLMKFLELRTHDYGAKVLSYPQPEIEEAARAAEAIFQAGWPDTYDAFVENGRVAP